MMLDQTNANVLSYVRTAPAGTAAVVVALNMSAQAQIISLDLAAAGVKATQAKTVVSDDPGAAPMVMLNHITLPPFGTWVGEVQ